VVSHINVRCLKKKASSSIGEDMTKKLSKRKIKWIIKQLEVGELSVCKIAKLQNISQRHVRRLYSKYKLEKQFPFPHPRGRKPEYISTEKQRLIIETYKQVPLCAVKMELYLDTKKIHIPHNTIHKILLANGLAKENKRKKRQRKYRFFARRFANHLWHTDYCKIKNKHYIAFIDDASRMVLASDKFSNATAANATIVLKKAILEFGVPKQLLTDNGTHFLSLIRKSCPNPEENVFQKELTQQGIKHIKTRIYHPQTNGKMERWFGTIKRLLKHYGDLTMAVHNYNYVIPHLSLTTCAGARTPAQAYVDKGGLIK
jgi:putative transposase